MLPIGGIIQEYEELYELPRDQILEGIQSAFEAVLRERYQRPIQVMLSEGNFEIVQYGMKNGVYSQFPLPIENIRGWNTLEKRIRVYLQKQSVFKDYDNLNRYHNTLVWGTHVATGDDGVAYFTCRLRLGEDIVCVCEPRRQMLVERREGYILGEIRAFMVLKIRAVLYEGVPRLKVALDRTSKNLPILLLREGLVKEGFYLKEAPMVPILRIPGDRSVIATRGDIPRRISQRVEEELREKLIILRGRKIGRFLSKTKTKKVMEKINRQTHLCVRNRGGVKVKLVRESIAAWHRRQKACALAKKKERDTVLAGMSKEEYEELFG